MPRFAYEAIDRTGAVARGAIEAATRAAAVDRLVAEGRTPTVLREDDGSASSGLRATLGAGRGNGDLLLIVRELATLLKAGLPAERALIVLIELGDNRRLKSRLSLMLARLRAGDPLSAALAAALPNAPAHVARLIAAGEASGHLPEVMTRLASGLSRAKALRDRLVSGLTYPALLVVATIVVLWVIFTAVLPRLAPMFADAGEALPAPTAALLAVSAFFETYGWFLLAAIVAAALGFAAMLRRESGRLAFDRTLLRSCLLLDLPRRYAAARFCRTLETLLDGGMTLARALTATRGASANRWFALRLGEAESAIASGERLKAALARTGVMPPLVVEFAAVGEETGRLGAMMGEAASILEREVETRIDRLAALVLPAATLTMGLVVALIMAGIVSGVLAVNDLAL